MQHGELLPTDGIPPLPSEGRSAAESLSRSHWNWVLVGWNKGLVGLVSGLTYLRRWVRTQSHLCDKLGPAVICPPMSLGHTTPITHSVVDPAVLEVNTQELGGYCKHMV